jgi:hypothetical protein
MPDFVLPRDQVECIKFLNKIIVEQEEKNKMKDDKGIEIDGTMKNPIIYYIRDGKNRPIITVALARTLNKFDTNGVNITSYGYRYYRGIALCSPDDNVDKEVGKALAIKRLRKAYHSEKVDMPIKNDYFFHIIMEFHNAYTHPGSLVYKSAADIKPKSKEMRLFGSAEKRYDNYVKGEFKDA